MRLIILLLCFIFINGCKTTEISSDIDKGFNESKSNCIFKKSLCNIQDALKEDDVASVNNKLTIHPRNSPNAKNPISISDFSIEGKQSIRFESNNGECGGKDCTTDRERVEVNYKRSPWKKEIWYRFYFYLPKDYNSIAPTNMSLIQWKRLNPSMVLIMFMHTHAGLTFNRNGDTFRDSSVTLKSNKKLLGSWTEIIFNTNWHPDPEKGFARVWVDKELKLDFKGRMNHQTKGERLSLRFGLYASFLERYKKTFNKKILPKRVIFFDGIKIGNKCEKIIDMKICNQIFSQKIDNYRLYNRKKYDTRFYKERVQKISRIEFDKLGQNKNDTNYLDVFKSMSHWDEKKLKHYLELMKKVTVQK